MTGHRGPTLLPGRNHCARAKINHDSKSTQLLRRVHFTPIVLYGEPTISGVKTQCASQWIFLVTEQLSNAKERKVEKQQISIRYYKRSQSDLTWWKGVTPSP